MARAARRSQKEIILEKINKAEEDIAKYNEKINKATLDKKKLLKELSVIEAKEKAEEEARIKAEEQAKTLEVVKMMQEKGMSIDDLKKILENKEV